jgi:hypothetical protein
MREGEKLISKAPGLEKTAGHLVPVHPRIPPRPGKWQQRREKYQQKIRLWPPSTPPCSACRIFGNVPKRSWSDFAMAEAVRLRQGGTAPAGLPVSGSARIFPSGPPASTEDSGQERSPLGITGGCKGDR